MKKSAAIYARYSSDLQNEASIDDQIRVCTEYAERNGWTVTNCFTDAGISGTSIVQRPGIQKLLQNAPMQGFDIVISEALDRISRDQEDVAHIFKRLTYEDIKMLTSSEGEITEMHIGLKGTMNALFIKDLAAKTHRGLRGRVEKGKSGGGIGYGYRVVKQFDANGEAIKGDREIDEDKGEIVRRIFHDYAHGNQSPKGIAAQLNEEGILAPSGKGWSQSTINGNRKRGTGILNNELYNGVMVWNRQRFIKDPSTGRRVPRYNDESELIQKDMPELRIVPQELWDAAKARQASLEHTKSGLWSTNRPQYILSGLLKCGVCEGSYSKISADRYGCATSKNKGTVMCPNRKTIKQDTLEKYVLTALQKEMMQEDHVKVFCDEYKKHLNEIQKQRSIDENRYRKEHVQLEKERMNLMQALKNGMEAYLIKDDLEQIVSRQKELEKLTKKQPNQKLALQPQMATRYQEAVRNLRMTLNDERGKSESASYLRTLVQKIVLTPANNQDGLCIDLYGDLAGILNLATQKRSSTLIEEMNRLKLGPIHLSVGSGGWI